MSTRRLLSNEIVSISFSSTLRIRDKQNLYSKELIAIGDGLETLSKFRFRSIMLITRNKAVVHTLRKSRQ